MKRGKWWGACCGWMLVGALGVACIERAEPLPGVGEAGAGGGADPGGAGSGGGGGEGLGGSDSACHSGFRVIDAQELHAAQIVSWPESHRFAVNTFGNIRIFELRADGSIAAAGQIEPADFGIESANFTSMATYGSGLVATVVEELPNAVGKLVHWTAGGDAKVLLSEPGRYMAIGAAVEGTGIAVAAGGPDRAVYVARLDGEDWSWAEPIALPGRRLAPLSFDDGNLLVGVEEPLRFKDAGEGAGGAGAGGEGAGGAGGVDSDSSSSMIQLWNEAGERVQSHEAFGNPAVAIATDAGWLIGETNSFWGSYNAGIELLGKGGELRKLSDVRVISAGDGEDGAHDLALLGDTLLVANCESGLQTAAWSSSSLTLAPAQGPWDGEGDTGECSVKAVEVIDDVAALSTDGKLMFVRACAD